MENSGDASTTLQLHPTLDFEICRKITQIESPKIQEYCHSDFLSRGSALAARPCAGALACWEMAPSLSRAAVKLFDRKTKDVS
jgi:hypothetical protein